MADWYYIGHYGQLGPLTFEQVEELVQGGVIGRETYVWRHGLADWQPASGIRDLDSAFQLIDPVLVPPPPPMSRAAIAPATPRQPVAAGYMYLTASPDLNPTTYGVVRSDRNRAVAGVLQFFPGVGRMYLGYWAHGVLQLVFSLCGGIGLIWSWIDGLIILAGGVKLDGYGRRLPE
ncbi:MAG: GYF domain-containing protein [Fimbriimonadales bacterium]